MLSGQSFSFFYFCSFFPLNKFKRQQGLIADSFQGRRCQILDKNKGSEEQKYDYPWIVRKSELTAIWHLNDFCQS